MFNAGRRRSLYAAGVCKAGHGAEYAGFRGPREMVFMIQFLGRAESRRLPAQSTDGGAMS